MQRQSLRLIELITCMMSSPSKKTLKTAPVESRQVFAQFATRVQPLRHNWNFNDCRKNCICGNSTCTVWTATTGLSTTVDVLQQRHLHETALSNQCNCRCTATGAQQPCQGTARRNLNGLLHSLHEGDTFHCGITAMSNSVDELTEGEANHCHLDGLLELVRHVHRDVTVEGPEEARHLVHGPEGNELAPRRLQVQDGEPIQRQEAEAIIAADFAPTITLVLVVPSLLPQGAVVLEALVPGIHPRTSRRRSVSSTWRAPSDSDWRLTSDFFLTL